MKAELYDELFSELDKLLKEHNPCKIRKKDSKVMCEGHFNTPCCHPACPMFSYDEGCTTNNLGCKLYLCSNAIKNLKDSSEEAFDKWVELAGLIGKLKWKECKYITREEAIERVSLRGIIKLKLQKEILNKLNL
jgi:hypothetical protein